MGKRPGSLVLKTWKSGFGPSGIFALKNKIAGSGLAGFGDWLFLHDIIDIEQRIGDFAANAEITVLFEEN